MHWQRREKLFPNGCLSEPQNPMSCWRQHCPRTPRPGETSRCQTQGRGRQPRQDVGRAGFVWLLPLPLGQNGTAIPLPQPFGSQISAYTQLLGLSQEREGLENSLGIQLTETEKKGHKSSSGKAQTSSKSIYRIWGHFFWVLLLNFHQTMWETELVIAEKEMTVSKGRGIKPVLPWRGKIKVTGHLLPAQQPPEEAREDYKSL